MASYVAAVLAGTRTEFRHYVEDHQDDTHYVWVREPQDARGYEFDAVVVVGSFNRRRHSASRVWAAVQARLKR